MSKTSSKPDLLTPAEVAEWLGMTAKALSNWRNLRRGPVFTKLGRMVRYERSAVEAFIDAGRVETA